MLLTTVKQALSVSLYEGIIFFHNSKKRGQRNVRELDDETGIGLIEKRRQGFGKVNVIYVKTFMPEKTDKKKFGEELKKFRKQTSVENE